MSMLTKAKEKFTFSFAHAAVVTLLLFVSMCILVNAKMSDHFEVVAQSQGESAALKEKNEKLRRENEQLQSQLEQANNRIVSLAREKQAVYADLHATTITLTGYRQQIEKLQPRPTEKSIAVQAHKKLAIVQAHKKPTQPKKPVVTALSTKSDRAAIATKTNGTWITFKATAYTAKCKGCSGVTATGYNVRDNRIDHRVIAVDPRVIPLHSIVEIKGMGFYKAVDTGGAIKGKRIDVLFQSHAKAMDFGLKNIQIRVVKIGKRDVA